MDHSQLYQLQLQLLTCTRYKTFLPFLVQVVSVPRSGLWIPDSLRNLDLSGRVSVKAWPFTDRNEKEGEKRKRGLPSERIMTREISVEILVQSKTEQVKGKQSIS
jgi:hypothetical protein